jgi:uncharacterized membrane protein AbrB (regulator of aidB expression)
VGFNHPCFSYFEQTTRRAVGTSLVIIALNLCLVLWRLEKLLTGNSVYISAFAIVGIFIGTPYQKDRWGKTKTSICLVCFNVNLYYNKKAYYK